MPKRCKSLPSSDCYKCSRQHTETYPGCINDADIPKCMGDIINPIETTCGYCICTLACPLYGQLSKSCIMCQDENVDYSEYYLHSHAQANPKCDTSGWFPSNNKCFKAFNERVQFDNANPSCGQLGNQNLAVLDSNGKRNAAKDAIAWRGFRNQYWVAATCNFRTCNWNGTNARVQNHFNNGCPKGNPSSSALRTNKGARWCNLSKGATRGFICEQNTCEVCRNNETCCPNQGQCKNGICVGNPESS